MLTEEQIIQFNNETKRYWMVTNFEEEILNWKFNIQNQKESYVIGHPPRSHKGSSVGDILPYTRLPELIKNKYPNSRVYVPRWFYEFFKFNPYVDGINNNVERWGSLGTWGTTVQRTCNVWGFQTFEFTPVLYHPITNANNYILICINSKTGGQVQNIKLFENIIEELKKKYYCVQLCVKGEPHLRGVNKYIFNLDRERLIPTISQFATYIGAQNSIYHLSKALGLKTIGVLPENVDPYYIMLPLLTQINHLELEMLSSQERERANLWKNKIQSIGKNPDESHHCGWLYPDSSHLTMNYNNETIRCPKATPSNVIKAINDEIYPFNDSRLWDVNNHRVFWGDRDGN